MYFWLVENADKDARKEIDQALQKPPPGVTAEAMKDSREWAPGAAGANFMAQLQARGGAGRVSVTGNRNVAT